MGFQLHECAFAPIRRDSTSMLEPDFLLRSLPLAAATAIGASIGSFLNVCVYRIPIGLTVIRPKRSFCPVCRCRIKAMDNIPVISWLVLMGRCRSCRAPIPLWYFLVELFAAIGSGIAYLKGGAMGPALFLLVYSLLTYALRVARAGHPSGHLVPVLAIAFAIVLYLQREGTRWQDLWKLIVCGLCAISLLNFYRMLSVERWNKLLLICSAALACGWTGALAAAAILTLVRKRTPDIQDAILLACVSLGPILL
jgi:prepilin signal peptidase PulO-like enzyme (type II secretory pathway)